MPESAGVHGTAAGVGESRRLVPGPPPVLLVALVLVTSVPGAGGNGAGARLQGWGLLTRTGLPCPLACSENASLGARAGLGSMRWAGRGRRCCPPSVSLQRYRIQWPIAPRQGLGSLGLPPRRLLCSGVSQSKRGAQTDMGWVVTVAVCCVGSRESQLYLPGFARTCLSLL